MDPISSLTQLSFKKIIYISLCIVLVMLHKNVTDALFLCIFGLLLFDRKVIEALCVFSVIRFVNPTLIELGPIGSYLGYLIPVAFIVKSFLNTQSPRYVLKWWPLSLFFLVALANSLLISKNLPVSLMKSLFWYGMVMGIMIHAGRASHLELIETANTIYHIVIVICLVSIPTLIYPNIAFATNGVGFQGVMNQPQVLGIMISPILAMVAWKLVYINKKPTMLDLAVLLGLIVIVLLTQSRTSAASVGISITISTLFVVFSKNDKKEKGTKKRDAHSLIIIQILVASLVAVIVLSTSGSEIAADFIYKGDEKLGSLGDGFYNSRGAIVASQIDSFMESPIIGNGFGVYPDGSTGKVTRLFGIPVGASVEKGVVFSSVLEELGIIGFVFFITIIFKILKQSIRNSGHWYAVIIISSLMVNFGEAVFFSPNGIGMYFWLMIAVFSHLAIDKRGDYRRKI